MKGLLGPYGQMAGMQAAKKGMQGRCLQLTAVCDMLVSKSSVFIVIRLLCIDRCLTCLLPSRVLPGC
jgi:hypothetical protein